MWNADGANRLNAGEDWATFSASTNARGSRTTAASSRANPFATYSGWSCTLPLMRLAASSRAPALPLFAALSSGHHIFSTSPLLMNGDENDESDEDVKDKGNERHGRVFTADDDNNRDHY